MKIFRNVIAVLLGVPMHLVIDTIIVLILTVLTHIPILSFLLTGFIPVHHWLACSIPYFSIPLTHKFVKSISVYEDRNYSIVITFSIILLMSIIGMFSRIIMSDFKWYIFLKDFMYIVYSIFAICAHKKDDDLIGG